MQRDPDQMLRSAASDLGLHHLPISILLDARHKQFAYVPFMALWAYTVL